MARLLPEEKRAAEILVGSRADPGLAVGLRYCFPVSALKLYWNYKTSKLFLE
jgi:hypothetical protein